MQDTNKLPWGWIISLGIASKVLLPLTAFMWVAFYSSVINPGHDAGYYEEYAANASSYVSIVTGIPIFFALPAWLGRRAEQRIVTSAILIWAIYVALDLPLLLFFDFSEIWLQTVVAHVTKVLAAYGGASMVLRQRLQLAGEGA